MKVLMVHNRYQQRGGEDGVFEAETALLEARGHRVLRYTKHNDQVADVGRATLARQAVWNGQVRREILDLIRVERPDVMHVHNTLSLISPAIYSAAHSEGVPVVQTLHNYRLLCPSAVLYRAGAVCEECLDTRTAWPGVLHGCYRNSHAATGVVAAMLFTHRLLGTWNRHIDQYVALSEFARQKFVEGGYPAEKICVNPNFVDPDPGSGGHEGGYALFVGRLSREKGVETLLRAAELVAEPSFRLKVVGDGPLRPTGSGGASRVDWLGRRPPHEVCGLMKSATVLVFPSEWYEGCPLTIVEAFATGLPIIAARLGTMAEMVADGKTGLHFTPGDAVDLAAKIDWAFGHKTDMKRCGLQGRLEFERYYTAGHSYGRLMEIYRMAAGTASSATRGPA